MMHNLLLREHNRVADKLSVVNPQWNDETVYQEARRIVAAEIQHIANNEWFPLIVGRSTMKKFNILPLSYGFTHDYDPSINPSIINSFATAAYRFHTLIQGIFDLMNNEGRITHKLQLRNLFNNPTSIYRRGAFDEFLNGFTAEPTQTFDKFFTQELTNHLFQEHGHHFGMDLISLNLQRGREHGLPGYNEYRKVCGMRPIESFSELNRVMQPGSAETFSQLYNSVDDIDLFIAGNHEIPLPDGVVGPTFACILSEQTRRSKLGDRFWFENGKLPHSFNEAQIYEIRKSSFAKIICDNSDDINKMQPLAFLQPAEWNAKINCDHIAGINLDLWKNERIWE
jgi:peroxidase